MSPLATRLAAVHAEIAAACARADRDPTSVTLVCVSKTHPAAALRAAFTLGEREFGESYVQEWLDKAEDPTLLGLSSLRWSFLGHLQRNKVRPLLGRVELIESVDSLRLASHIARLASERGGGFRQPVLLQVDLADQSSKGGFDAHGLREALPDLLTLPGLAISGLMHIPPPRPSSEAARADHRALATLRDTLQDATGTSLPTLSMGMSSDFAVAIEEGATRVRIGTAVFGAR